MLGGLVILGIITVYVIILWLCGKPRKGEGRGLWY